MTSKDEEPLVLRNIPSRDCTPKSVETMAGLAARPIHKKRSWPFSRSTMAWLDKRSYERLRMLGRRMCSGPDHTHKTSSIIIVRVTETSDDTLNISSELSRVYIESFV